MKILYQKIMHEKKGGKQANVKWPEENHKKKIIIILLAYYLIYMRMVDKEDKGIQGQPLIPNHLKGDLGLSQDNPSDIITHG